MLICCRYSLENNGNGLFTIDAASGLVTTLGPLDRELQDEFSLVVKATDAGLLPLDAVVTLDIHIDDVNDNAPRFLQREYSVFVREPTNQGALFCPAFLHIHLVVSPSISPSSWLRVCHALFVLQSLSLALLSLSSSLYL